MKKKKNYIDTNFQGQSFHNNHLCIYLCLRHTKIVEIHISSIPILHYFYFTGRSEQNFNPISFIFVLCVSLPEVSGPKEIGGSARKEVTVLRTGQYHHHYPPISSSLSSQGPSWRTWLISSSLSSLGKASGPGQYHHHYPPIMSSSLSLGPGQ